MGGDSVVYGAIREEIEGIANSKVEKLLDGKVYNAGDVQTWTNQISKETVEEM
jgi:hypothetical protein